MTYKPARRSVLIAIVLLASVRAAAAQTCAFTVSGGTSVEAVGGTLRFLVRADPASCRWTAVPESGGLTIARAFEPPDGDGYFDVVVAPNLESVSWTRWLRVIGDDGFANPILIMQPPAGPCRVGASTARNPVVVPSTGGALVVTVTTATDFTGVQCWWSVSSNVGWLAVPGDSRPGDGVFTVEIPPNGTPYARYGVIRVAVASSWALVHVEQDGTLPVRNVEIGGGLGADAVLYDPGSGRYDVFTLGADAAGVSSRRRIDFYTWGTNQSITPADFNHDGLTDMLVVDPTTGECAMHLARRSYAIPGSVFDPWDCGVAPVAATPIIIDANGDRRSDIFFYNQVSGEWLLKIARDVEGLGGTIYEDARSGTWAGGWQIHAARFDGDAYDDLFLYNPSPSHPYGGMWFRVFTRDELTFEYHLGDIRWARGWTLVPGDFDGDGLTEIFLHGSAGLGAWFIVDFEGSTTRYASGLWAPGWQVQPADFNGDGRCDLFLYQAGPGPLAGYWFRALSTGAGGFEYVAHDLRWAGGWRVSVGDLDADGLSDVFIDGRGDGLAAQVLTRDGGYGTSYVYEAGWPAAPAIVLSRTITP